MNLKLLDFQSEIKQILLNTRNKNRLSHAYIFQGPKGVGKKEMALFFADMLYEEKPELDSEVFKNILNNEHVNVFVVETDDNTIKKESIISLQQEFSKTSQVEGPRIYIIIDADKMNPNSQNSLLKFIEEPYPGIYGILCTTNISQLLPTITSRCQTLNFKSLDEETLKNELVGKGLDINKASIISTLTNNVDEALKLNEDDDTNLLITSFEQFLKVRKIKDAIAFRMKYIKFFENSNNLTKFINLLIILYEDILSMYHGSINIHLNGYVDLIVKLKENITKEKTIDNLELLYSLNRKLLANVSAKNIASNLFVNLF